MNPLKKFILSLLYYIRHRKSYAQDGEDVALAAFFESRKGYKGFFVDVGAHHPVRFSNTWMFYRNGWKGINIDPTPGSMNAFKWLRKRDINLEIGIGAARGIMKFFCFNEPALNTFDEDVALQKNTGRPYKVIKTVDVPILPLSDVFDQYLQLSQKIDFLTVDVEGLDLAVLKSNNWNKYSPDFILVEETSFKVSEINKSAIYEFLAGQGYDICAVLKRTIIYKKV